MISNRQKTRFFLTVLLLLWLGVNENLSAQVYETTNGHVEFDSSVPLHSFTGKSDQLTGQINLSEGIVDYYVDLTTVKTGVGARDRDMRETLNTDKYPFAEFYGSLETIPDSLMMKPVPVKVKGEFKVHGVSRKIEVEGTLEKTSEGIKVMAAWDLNIKDYNIEPPGILFYRVSEIQKIRIEAVLMPKKSM